VGDRESGDQMGERDAGLVGERDELFNGVDADLVLTDDLLDRIDAIVPPGTDIGQLDMAYQPAALTDASLRRRTVADRAAATR
jgi:aryl-alcohol dehydrogenase (NADP+)